MTTGYGKLRVYRIDGMTTGCGKLTVYRSDGVTTGYGIGLSAQLMA